MGFWDDVADVSTGGLWPAAQAIGGAIGGSGGVGIGNPLGGEPQIQGPQQGNFAYGQGLGTSNAEAAGFGKNSAWAQNRQAPGFNWTSFQNQGNMSDEDRKAMQQAYGGLAGVLAKGPGPSVAAAQMTAGEQQAARNAQNLVANANPSQGGMGLAAALQSNASGGLSAAQQGAIGALQEKRDWQNMQLQGYGQLGSMGAAMRSGDVNAQQAYLAQQGLISQNQLGQTALNDRAAQAYAQNQLAVQNADLNARMNYAQMGQQAQEFNAGQSSQQRQQNLNFTGSLLNSAGGVLGSFF